LRFWACRRAMVERPTLTPTERPIVIQPIGRLSQSAIWLTLLLLSCTFAGCGGYKVAEVDGTLTIQGKPANKIHIQFIPVNQNGTKLPMANGDTDEQGKFVMAMVVGSAVQNGAVVGTNRVVLSDSQYADADGKGVPLRLKPEYTMPGSTPLTQEVAEGKQTIEIKLP
jgi:hypothetical protein